MSSQHTKASNSSEEDDPVDVMLKKTGCIELHHRVQECFAEHHDWRKCQKEVKEFKLCMGGYIKDKPSKSSSRY